MPNLYGRKFYLTYFCPHGLDSGLSFVLVPNLYGRKFYLTYICTHGLDSGLSFVLMPSLMSLNSLLIHARFRYKSTLKHVKYLMVIMTAIVFLIIMFGNKSLLLRSFGFFASFMMLRVKLVASFLLMLS